MVSHIFYLPICLSFLWAPASSIASVVCRVLAQLPQHTGLLVVEAHCLALPSLTPLPAELSPMASVLFLVLHSTLAQASGAAWST